MSAPTPQQIEPPGLAWSAAQLQGLGRPIKGPSALGSDPRRLWHLTWTLAKTEFKLAFFGSALGYLWQLMRPLLLFGVIYAVISAVLGRFASSPNYPVALLLGIVLFNFYSESSGGAVASLVTRENLVRKIEFPRLAVPLATVLTALLNFCLNLVPVFIFLLAAGGSVRLSWLELPLLMLALATFTSGLGMILSVAYVRYRDVRPIWEVVLQMTFYASPIFYPITAVHHQTVLGVKVNLAHVMMSNPFVAILEQARHAVINPAYPSAAKAIGGGAMILIPIGIAIAIVVGGFLFFDREAPRVAEQL
ncbi:MAG: type transport system permease protein [Solirubrobacteraceae bacterium]|nr:type transport system permease protein [Solirubrobacteraceae bacterium]